MEKVQSLLNTLCAIAIPIVIAFFIPKVLLDLLSAKSKALGAIRNGAQGLAGKVRERAEGSAYYQRRAMARNQRKAERQRSATQSYSNAITDTGWRGRQLRRRAGGIGNVAGQNRALVGGMSALEKLEHQEDSDAAVMLKHNGIQSPSQLATLVAGGTVTGADGKTKIDGSKNKAFQRTALRQILDAEDAGALNDLFTGSGSANTSAGGAAAGGAGVDMAMLRREVQDKYAHAKAAGAHFVGAELSDPTHTTPYTQTEVNKEAAVALSGLNAPKLAAQDAASWKAAYDAYSSGSLSQEEQRNFYDAVRRIESDPQASSLVKGKVSDPNSPLSIYNKFRGVDPANPGAPPTPLPRP